MSLPHGPSPPYPLDQHSFRAPNGRPLSDMDGYSSTSGSNPPHKPYPHLSDLQLKATQGLNVNQTLKNLFAQAEGSLNSAQSSLEFRRPDIAYTDYLRAFEILVNIVPRHRDLLPHSPAQQAHQKLLRRVSAQTDQFARIKDIIVNDNKRNGTQPMGSRRQSTPSQSTQQEPNRSSTQASHAPPTNPHSHPYPGKPTYAPPPPVPSTNHGVAPTPTHGTEALNERFARLRMMPTSGTTNPASAPYRRPDSRASVHSNTSATSRQEYSPAASTDSLNRVTSNGSFVPPALRPTGPRSMPSPRLPLDTEFAAAMPKAPSPTYSPARNMQLSGHMEPPRSTARSIVGTGGRNNSVMSASSVYASSNNGSAPEGDDSGHLPHQAPNGHLRGSLPRRKSVHMPREIRIGPERLYDYLKMHSILLIDVRSRDDFDDGHIYAQSTICVDPTALRRDMSAEDIQDSLVLSPEAEQIMFDERHKYDLVVYYDYSTSSDRFLSRPSTEQEWKLRFLYDALYEFNEKPLQRPPILLMGGIEAWTELVGDQALQRSSTAARIKAARPIRRVPVGNAGSRLYVPKKRLRDYNPLDADEEQKWRERARVESVVVEEKPLVDGESDGQAVHQADDATPFYDHIEEFLRRFPDAGKLEQRPMVDAPPQYPHAAPRVPSYPAPPPPSSMPSIPSRPAPAVARPSYSGVSERSVSSTSQNASSQHLPAYVPPRYLPKNLRLPRTGLVNFGVTCYMNATIQALSATTPLTLFFLDDRFKQHVQRDNWKGSKGVLPELYANLIRSIWKGDVEAIRPSTLRSFCARLNSEWGIDRQQDAKEFFDFLVDCLHEDLNENWARTPLKALTAQQEAVREKMPRGVVCRTEWGRYTHREQSFLTSLFAGQHASRLKCTTCHFTSTTYEAFYSISVEIPRSGTRGTLQDCLRSYCAEEMLSGDEVWKCPRCNKQREATKKITITRAPRFLVVHFKRFSAGRGQSARKVRTPIEFPLTGLDLGPYMLPPPTPEETRALAASSGSLDSGISADDKDPAMTPPFRYDAYAVMRHIGTTLTSGHYVALAKDRARGCWRQFNDTAVGDFDPDRLAERDRLQNEMAYIVFYQRVED